MAAQARDLVKIGRNQPCWCGSGKKYKRCHLDRDAQAPLGRQDILEGFNKEFARGNCLHPNAGTSTCEGQIIRAHTIQRNGGLNRIARNGHVYSVLKHGPMFRETTKPENLRPNLVGIRTASTFTGFCARHDDELFAPIEKESFTATPEQVALLGYRAISHELYLKEHTRNLAPLQRDMDKGLPSSIQQMHQEMVMLFQAGVSKAIKELTALKDLYDDFVFRRAYEKLGHYVVGFRNTPDFMSSAVAQATHDFRGRVVQRLGDLSESAGWLTFSLIATDDGGAAVFSWPNAHKNSENMMRTFDSLSDEELPHAIVRFVFEFFENTYLSPNWWEGLEESMQHGLMMRQLSGPLMEFPRSDDCLLDDGIRIVDWPIIYRLTSLRRT